MKRVLVSATVLCCLVLFAACAFAGNPFTGGHGTDSTARSEAAPERVAPAPASFFAPVHAWLAGQQRELRSRLSAEVRRLGTHPSPVELSLFLCVAFAYGVLHAAGPGHGKSVLAAYLLSRGGGVGRAVGMGLGMGCAHAASAVGLVLVMHLALDGARMSGVSQAAAHVERSSHLLVFLVGLWLVAQALRELRRGPREGGEDVSQRVSGARGAVGVALAAGMIPCPGATLIMLFSIGQNALPLGLAASAVMAAGMGTTIAAVGVAVVSGRRGTLAASGAGARRTARIRGLLAVAGGAAVAGLGAVLFLAAL
ncbi:ABC-type nickel/cobalt efflux system permease component RcnA [Desulfobaculum xiamenense]|uniref:Nickel/cobalt efflux system n=1 Tax=Desulfobaculum xiamenense TaxID=995050 RepID=A0A846QLS2_9BACT|nr:hypothetical protein [Desulfobaculum xiamenense]NJB69118.1 ABC-type nickel/cobalt efflux system permease component RcnA [Desulfobaculum xiamenense]